MKPIKKLLCLPISFLLLSSFTNRKASTTSFDGKAYNSKEKMDFTSSTEEDKPIQNSKISENPTVDVNSVASISDFKGKGPNDILL